MRWLILFPIYIYWYAWPPFLKKRYCLFKESCSQFVFRVTKESGFVAGYKAMIWRYRNCRPGYRIVSNAEGKFEMRLVTGNMVPESEIADAILKPYLNAMKSALALAGRANHLAQS
jgi:putative component of membrane protein insertase Oxa1/YidC/SpoIIIJ protein YidD